MLRLLARRRRAEIGLRHEADEAGRLARLDHHHHPAVGRLLVHHAHELALLGLDLVERALLRRKVVGHRHQIVVLALIAIRLCFGFRWRAFARARRARTLLALLLLVGTARDDQLEVGLGHEALLARRLIPAVYPALWCINLCEQQHVADFCVQFELVRHVVVRVGRVLVDGAGVARLAG